MDEIIIESVLKKIIEIDENTDQTIEQLQLEIKDREKKLKEIKRSIEENSNQLQAEQGRKLYEQIMSEANQETEAKESECKNKLTEMDRQYETGKAVLIEDALRKLSLK